MRPKAVFWGSTFLALLLAMSVLQPVQTQQPETGRRAARTIQYVPGRTIESQILPSDRILTVDNDTPPGMSVGPPPESGWTEAEWRTLLVDFVAVVGVTEKTSTLNARRDWVTSTVSATVLEVLKNDTVKEVRPGDLIAFIEPGGEIVLNDKIIKARITWARPTAKGRTYLIFGVVNEQNELLTGPGDRYELTGTCLSGALDQPGRRDPIDGTDFSEIKPQILGKATAATLRPK